MNPPRLIPFEPRQPRNEIAPSPLSIRGLTVTYDDKPAVWDLDYDAPDRGLIAVIGPNGAGKSTMIKAVLGLVPALAGDVRVFGSKLRHARRRIAYIPQRTSVDWDFPVTALDVVCMGLYRKIGWFRPVRARHRKRAMEALAEVGMQDYAKRQISQLSGGQQQRVFLARALVQDAELFLMDEPLAGVDVATEKTIINTLHRLRDQGRTAMVVHHDLDTVSEYFDRVLLLNQHIIAEGSSEEVMTPEHLKQAYGGKLLILT